MINKIIQFVPFILIFYIPCIHGALLNPIPRKVEYDRFENHQEMYNKEWDDPLIRELQLQPSLEPIPSPESFLMFSELEVEETPEISGEDEEFLAAASGLDKELELVSDSYDNHVWEEPRNDSKFIIIQDELDPQRRKWEKETKNTTFGNFILTYSNPICVIPRKQMKCFIRKRCGVYRENGKRVTPHRRGRTRGPVFNWARKPHCSFQCGWKAGRNCISGSSPSF